MSIRHIIRPDGTIEECPEALRQGVLALVAETHGEEMKEMFDRAKRLGFQIPSPLLILSELATLN